MPNTLRNEKRGIRHSFFVKYGRTLSLYNYSEVIPPPGRSRRLSSALAPFVVTALLA